MTLGKSLPDSAGEKEGHPDAEPAPQVGTVAETRQPGPSLAAEKHSANSTRPNAPNKKEYRVEESFRAKSSKSKREGHLGSKRTQQAREE